MLSVFAFDAKGPRVIDDPNEISELIKRPKTVVWADLEHPTDADLEHLQSEFGLHPLAMEDVKRQGQRPKFDMYENHSYLVAYASTNEYRDLSEVDIFVGRNWLITVHEQQEDEAEFDITSVRERAQRTQAKNITVAFLLYTVLDEIVDTYFGAVDRIGVRVDDIEERIFGDEDPERDERPLQREMLQIRKEVLGFRRRVVPLREVLLQLLRDDLPFMGPNSRHYYEDVFDHVMRITDEIDNQRELIGNAVDAHLAMVSNQMNATMKKMTSWGAILIVSTLISGIFGMNFDDMPQLHWRHGFYLSLVVMVGMTTGFYLYFKKKRWI